MADIGIGWPVRIEVGAWYARAGCADCLGSGNVMGLSACECVHWKTDETYEGTVRSVQRTGPREAVVDLDGLEIRLSSGKAFRVISLGAQP